MLKILLESFLLDCAELNKDADKEINYLYETLEGNFLTDLQKEIKSASIGIQELKLLAYQIITSEEFKEELSDLSITIEQDLNLDDVICMVNFDEVSEREVLALIKGDEVKFLEHEEIGCFIGELIWKEDKFQSAYMCDSKIVCRFKDEQFVIDLI